MNRLTEASRINAIRERLLEKQKMGLLGVIAAKANVPEYVLVAWCNSPVDVPSREMTVKIQDAVSEHIVMSAEARAYGVATGHIDDGEDDAKE